MRRNVTWAVLSFVILFSNGGLAQQKRNIAEVDAAGLKKAVAGLNGKVVFVNFWATWCAPCVAEFPDMVKLYQKFHPQGLEVIAVTFDEQAATAIPFLDRQKAEFITLQKSPKQDDDAFRIGFDKDWGGAIPATWLFDPSGKRVYFQMAKFNPAALEKQIADLLAAKK
jgi:thiol-disulfide isomerase/thioredoxin